VDGCIIEAGPDSFLSEKPPWASELCRELGIGDQLIASNDGQRKTYILVNGRLLPIPAGLMFMVPTKILPTVISPLFSMRTKIRMARELFQRPRAAQDDESVATLIERHYGPEVVERLAGPLLCGIYGAEATALSARAVLPRLIEMERTHGSLGRVMLSAKRNRGAQAAVSRPLFTSLRNGMQQMVEAIVAQLPVESLRTRSPVRSLHPGENGWRLSTESNAVEHFDFIVLATPAAAASALLDATGHSQGVHVDLARELRAIEYSSSVTITLGYKKPATNLPPGFGFLVPRREGKRMLACTFVHNKFPYRAPADRALVRCFLGGSRDEDVLSASDRELLKIVSEELRQILGLNAEPLFARIYKWRAAMPQYAVGHLDRMNRIEKLLQQLPGLALIGNGYRGIGIPDCIWSGMEAANQAVSAGQTVSEVKGEGETRLIAP
jgi:oxygen-dependent protoporphyrinogen oxidase